MKQQGPTTEFRPAGVLHIPMPLGRARIMQKNHLTHEAQDQSPRAYLWTVLRGLRRLRQLGWIFGISEMFRTNK